MAGNDLSYWDYVKDAFRRAYPVPGMGPLPVNYMGLAAFGVLGLLNPGFWFLGVAAEVVYLTGLAGNGRYQKLVQAERLEKVQVDWEESVTRAVSRLEPRSRERYLRLLHQCRQILGHGESIDVSLGNLRDLRARSLNQLLGIFLRLLASREAISETVEGLERARLEKEIADLRSRLGEAGDNTALARSIEGTLEIQQKRLENHQRASGSLQVIDAELARIEQQVELIREEAVVSGGPEALSHRLDAVTSTMSETTRWMDEQASLLGGLGTDDALAPLSDLPRLPDDLGAPAPPARLAAEVPPPPAAEAAPVPERRTESEG